MFFFCWSNSLVAKAHTIKYGEVGCPGFEPRPCINYAMSLPTELSSRGHYTCFFVSEERKNTS